MRRRIAVGWILAGVVGALASTGTAASPFDGLSFEVPKSQPCGALSQGDLKGVWLDGESWKGRPTKVFAFVILPKGASAERKVPGMVLAHGGGGSAYPGWARTWADRGYAVIVPDTCGAMPVWAPGAHWIRTGIGGPAGWGRVDLADEPVGDQWPYHAVGAVVRAHSYLRSLPEVDADRIGLTGISWGGFLTMLTAATDRRFKFAAPVYACGYYKEMMDLTDFYRKEFGTDEAARRRLDRWCDLFDPLHYVPKIEMPLFWFAAAGDKAFPFDTLQKTVALARAVPQMAVRVGMQHSHGPAGENLPELFRFADHLLKGAAPLPQIGRPNVTGGIFSVGFDLKGNRLKRVDLVWCESDRPVYETPWRAEAHSVPEGNLLSVPVPPGARRAYANFVLDLDLKGAYYKEALVSSPAWSAQEGMKEGKNHVER